jgi:hypothetical protein
MNDLTLERYRNDARLRSEIEAAARRERALYLKRFLEQVWRWRCSGAGETLPARGLNPAHPCDTC